MRAITCQEFSSIQANQPKNIEKHKKNPTFEKSKGCIQMSKDSSLYNKIINYQTKQWTEMLEEVKVQESNKQPKMQKRTKNASSQSEEFQLQYHQIKKLGLPVNKKKLRIGNWAPEENLIYLKFLQNNRKDFISEQERRKNKVFYRLSKILKKRTPDQCRSHHQKLQMKYEDDIEEIIQSIRRKLEKKSPQLIWDEMRKLQNENKKTGIVDTYQVQKQEGVIIEEGEFYKIRKNGQSQFALQIFVDQIKPWC